MGLIVPRSAQAVWQNNLAATPSLTALGTNVVADAIAHTKGLYSQIFASTTYDSYGFWLGIHNTAASTADSSMLLDIAIGADTAEVVILPDFMCGFQGRSGIFGGISFIPLFIPKGSRVSARIQALTSADTVDLAVWLNGGASGPMGNIFTGCDAYGVVTADSGGTAHTPGNTGAESTDAGIPAATTLSRNYGAVMLRLGFSGTAMTAIAYHWELTDGTNTLAEWYSTNNGSEEIYGPFPPGPIARPLAIGTQLQIQAEASGTAQAHDVAFYCFY